MEKNYHAREVLLVMLLWFGVAVYGQLPTVTLKTIDGKTVNVDTLSNGGRPMVIDFFATWCKPCNRELSAISEVYADWQAETGVRLIAVSIDQAHNIHKVRPMVDRLGWPYEVLLDPTGELKRTLGVQLIPYTLVIDGSGKIVHRHQGYTDGEEETLFEELKQLSDQLPD